MAAMQDQYRKERLWVMGLLLVIAVVVQVVYTLHVRPKAEGWLESERAAVAANPDYKARQSIWVIIKDAEQESVIILAIWGLCMAFMTARGVTRHRRQLEKGLLKVPAGFRILPTDVREYARKIEDLPANERNLIPARTIRRALKRFGETANVQDAATTVHDYCESEAARLDAELALIRFCVWATPAIGFVGTVRGIGNALAGAQSALRGDTGPVTGGLGIAFNSTFVALIFSIVLMYVVHELQLRQERLVLDTELYVDDAVLSNLQAR
jgi:biopolymer transport protein ExbB/TolQ